MNDKHQSPECFMPGLFIRPSNFETMQRVPLLMDWKRSLGAQSPGQAFPEQDEAKAERASRIDFSLLNEIFEDFLEVTGLPIAILDLDGRVLASSRWQRLCMEFHRAN